MTNNNTTFQERLEQLKRGREERKLQSLQAKYQNPEKINYGNMSLREELQTRFDLDEMNRLSAKLGSGNNNIGKNSDNTMVGTLQPNTFANQTGFYKPISQEDKDNEAIVSSLRAYKPNNQNSFYTVTGKPMPSYVPKSHAWEIAAAALQGFGEGIESGMLTAVNGATNGYFDKLSSKYLGDYYNKNKQQMQRQAEAAGLGRANKIANDVIEYGAKAWADAKSAGAFSGLLNQFGLSNWLKK